MPQKGIITLPSGVGIISTSSVGGAEEEKGPIGAYLDVTDVGGDDKFSTDTWEGAEGEMQKRALTTAIAQASCTEHDIDAVFAGDLQNQCVGSNYGLLDFDIPYFGLYGACSTCAEALILAAVYASGLGNSMTAAVASSHNCAAERQFRYPVEYGGQRAPTSQWTVTGAGAFILSSGNIPAGAPRIVDFLPGRSIDRGINDLNNMGASMAPAAIDTLSRYFDESGRTPDSFDMILTGDLGVEGSRILRDFLPAVAAVHEDCGLLVYDTEGTDKHGGGSGCGCSATVLSSIILPRMGLKKRSESYVAPVGKPLHDILFMATGALMSPASVWQGNNIPGICHLVHIVADIEGKEGEEGEKEAQ